MDRYDWPPREQFVNRVHDLAQLESWWEHPTRDAMALVGRRRVGKSWLFRQFAHGKPAVILVADRRLLTTQMARFAGVLEAELGVRPEIRGVGGLIRLLYGLGREHKLLTVVDEFPFLLPEGRAREEILSEMQAVMEDHRDSSHTKLLPATYFSILEVLAAGPTSTERLGRELQLKSASLTFYLDTLREMRLLSSAAPVGAPEGSRSHRHRVSDGFIRFWFRFVFGNQAGLQEGLSPHDLWVADVQPHLAEFIASSFEELCVRYTRRVYGAAAPNVGAWWGPALHKYRHTKERLSEEIDVVGARRRSLKVAGECKWTSTPMPKRVLDDLREFKLPAVAQEGRLKVPVAGPAIVLFARSGFAPELVAEADADERVTLVDLDTLVSELDREAHAV